MCIRDRSLSARRGSGVRLRRRRGTASHMVAASPREVREVRAVVRRPFGERWPRAGLQSLVCVAR
eukprot:755309-Alexandrium_andersonii.AAC.1